MAPTNREILFVLKFKNQARQAITQFGSNMRAVAAGANAAATAASALQKNAMRAAAAVNTLATQSQRASTATGGFATGSKAAASSAGAFADAARAASAAAGAFTSGVRSAAAAAAAVPSGVQRAAAAISAFTAGAGQSSSAAAAVSANATRAAGAINTVNRNVRQVAGEAGGGFSDLARRIREANDQANGLARTIARVAGGAALLFGGKEVIKQGDDYSTLLSRLRLVTDNQQNLNDTYEALFRTAQNNRVELGSTAELYSRLANATEQLGFKQSEVLTMTDAITKAMTIGGGSAESTKAAIIQLSQGFASGTLRGEELNSVLEQAPRLAQVIADGLKVPVGSLRDLASQGKITSEAVGKALLSQKEKLDREFLAMNKTVSGAWTVLGNAVLDFIGRADAATGATTNFAENIIQISSMLRDPAFIKAGTAAMDMFGQALLGITSTVKAAIEGISQFSSFLQSGSAAAQVASAVLNGVGAAMLGIAAASVVVAAALSLNPIVAFAGAIAGIAVALYQLRNATISWGSDTVRVGDLATAIWEKLSGAVAYFSGMMQQAWEWVTSFSQSISTYFAQIAASSGTSLTGFGEAVRDIIKTALNYWVAYFVTVKDIVFGAGKTLVDAVANIAKQLYAKLSAIADGMGAALRGDFATMTQLFAEAYTGGITTGVADNLSGIADKIKENFRTDYVDTFASVVVKTLEDLKAGSITTMEEVHARAKQIEAERQKMEKTRTQPDFSRYKQAYNQPLNQKVQEEIEKLKAEARLVGLNEQERERLNTQLDIEKIARQEGIKDVQRHVDAYLKEYDALQRLKQAYQDNPWNGLKAGMDEFAQSASKLADNVASAWNNALNGVADTLADLIVDGKADFKSLVNNFAKQMLSAGIKNAMGNAINGLTGQATIQARTVTVSGGTVTIAGVSGQLGGLATNNVASIAGGAIPVTPLATSRAQFGTELSDPNVLRQLYAMTNAEVGGQGPQAQQAFMESIFNRADSRDMTLAQTLSDKGYFPQSTFNAASGYMNQDLSAKYDAMLAQVRAGSNVSNYATGNASGTVGFAGGPQTAAYNGERYGIEGPDNAWAQQMQEMARVQQVGSEQQIAQAQQAQQQITSSYQQTAQQAQTITPQFGQMGQNLTQLVGPLASVVPGLGQFSGALQQVMSFILKGIGSFGGGSIGLFHTGGVVGGPASAYRKVPMAAFALAQRYHTGGIAGFKPNEVPAILQRRERVLTEAQGKNYDKLRARAADGIGALSAAMQPVATKLNLRLGDIHVKVDGGSSGDRKKDADFGDEIASKIALANEKQVLAIIQNQQRPGGMLFQGRTK